MNYHQILPVWHLKLTSEPTMQYIISAALRLSWHQISCSKTLRCECDNKDPQFGGGALLIVLSTLQAMCCKMCLSVAFSFVRVHVYRMGLDIVFSFWTRYVADVWSHPGYYLVHPPTPPWSHWDKAISDSDVATLSSRSWVWSKGKVI